MSNDFLEIGAIIEDIATGLRAVVIGTQGDYLVLWINPECIKQIPRRPSQEYIDDFCKHYYIRGNTAFASLEDTINSLIFEENLLPS